MPSQCRQCSSQNPREIKRRHSKPSEKMEILLNGCPKFIKHKHVEAKVNPIGVDECVRENAMPFTAIEARIRVQHESVFSRVIHEPPRDDQRTKDDKMEKAHSLRAVIGHNDPSPMEMPPKQGVHAFRIFSALPFNLP